MKLDKLLNKIMGLDRPPEILNQLEDLGFIDTEKVTGDYKLLEYKNHRVLYNIEKDRVESWYKVRSGK